jgi:hypothetical protein
MSKANAAREKRDLAIFGRMEKAALAATAIVRDTAATSVKENRLALSREKAVASKSAALAKKIEAEVNTSGNHKEPWNSKPQTASKPAADADAAGSTQKPAVTTPKAKTAHTVTQAEGGKFAKGHVFMKQPTVDEDLLEVGESHDLGESMYARPKLSKLKQEQFALVNAQSKLNHAMSARKHIEDKEAKQLELKEKTDVATEKLDQKSTQQNLQRQIDADVKQTTKIDEFMAHDNKLKKEETKDFKGIEVAAQEGARDELIASKSAAETEKHFKEFYANAQKMASHVSFFN